MPIPMTLGAALRMWRERRRWHEAGDLANGLLNDGFARAFSTNPPDADELTRIIEALENGGDWPWLTLDYELFEPFADHCRHCLRLSRTEREDLLDLIAMCYVKSIRP